MYFDDFISVEQREMLCYHYFDKYNITNRDQLRESLKQFPLENVTVRFAEEMLVDYLELKRRIKKSNEVINTKDSKRSTAFVINDLHIPYQDDVSLNLVFDCIIDNQPDYLVLNGDILDCYGCSKFEKKPDRNLLLQDEIDIFYRKFKNLRKSIPNTEIHYNLGNHEQRINTVVSTTSKSSGGLYNLDALDPLTLFKLDKLNIIPHDTTFSINDYLFAHGDVVRKDSSYSARAELIDHHMKTGISAHTHRLGSYYHTYNKELVYWHENGCICSLNPDYFKDQTKVNWQQGFAVINFVENLAYTQQIAIIEHSFIYNNKIYK